MQPAGHTQFYTTLTDATLADRPSAPGRVWNRIAPEVQDQIVEMALEQSELSPRELAVRFTDERQYLCPKLRFTACSRPTI